VFSKEEGKRGDFVACPFLHKHVCHKWSCYTLQHKCANEGSLHRAYKLLISCCTFITTRSVASREHSLIVHVQHTDTKRERFVHLDRNPTTRIIVGEKWKCSRDLFVKKSQQLEHQRANKLKNPAISIDEHARATASHARSRVRAGGIHAAHIIFFILRVFIKE